MAGTEGYKVKASFYTDSGATAYTKHIEKLTGDSYAELSTPGTLDFKAMGGLPANYPLLIVGPKGAAMGYKRDVGKGGPNKPVIDLHRGLAEKVGVTGITEVTIFPLREDAAAYRLAKALSGKAFPLDVHNAAEEGKRRRDHLPDGKATTTIGDAAKDVTNAAGKALDAFGLGDLKDLFGVLYQIVKALTDRGFWIRAGQILIGFIVLFLGLAKLGKVLGSGRVAKDAKTAGGAVKTVGKLATATPVGKAGKIAAKVA